jgi:hypothetical protein
MEIRVRNPRNPKNPGEAWEISRSTLNEIIYEEELPEQDRSINWKCDPSIFN